MEAEIKAGAKLDMLTKSELQEVMDGLDFNVKIGRGLKFRRIVAQMPITNTQALEQGFGPDPGFTWAIQGANTFVYDTADLTTAVYTLFYLNNRNAYINIKFYVESNGTGGTPVTFPKTAHILHSGDLLIPTLDPSTPATVNNMLSIALDVIEVPTFSEGLLNL